MDYSSVRDNGVFREHRSVAVFCFFVLVFFFSYIPSILITIALGISMGYTTGNTFLSILSDLLGPKAKRSGWGILLALISRVKNHTFVKTDDGRIEYPARPML